MKTKNASAAPQPSQGAKAGAGCVERLVRPPDASINGLRKCLRWIDACREIGWADAVMPDLEALFWQYHDKDGNKKPNEKAQLTPKE